MSDSSTNQDVTPALPAPTLELLEGNPPIPVPSQNVIVNTAEPIFGGIYVPGNTVFVTLQNGIVLSGGTGSSPPGSSTTYTTSRPPTPLSPGSYQATAEQSNPQYNASVPDSVSALSNPVNLFVLPDPVGNVTAADVSSAQIATLLGQGYTPSFVPGTEAVTLTDGTLFIGPDTNEALVQRLYVGLLGRGADLAGLEQNDAQLYGGSSPVNVAASILGSPEYQALHGTPASTSDAQFVTNLYQGFLGRAPDQAGLGTWVAALGKGTSRAQVAANFAQSSEAKANLAADTSAIWIPSADGGLVTQLYQTAFDRTPDAAGLQSWTQALQGGLTPAQFAEDLVNTTEFQTLYAGQDSTQLISSFYQNALGRAPDAAGLAGWLSQTQSSGDLSQALLGIASSSEAAARITPSL
jgi:hypothetical protein